MASHPSIAMDKVIESKKNKNMVQESRKAELHIVQKLMASHPSIDVYKVIESKKNKNMDQFFTHTPLFSQSSKEKHG